MNRLGLTVATTMVLVAGMAMSQDASAVQRVNVSNGAGACQGALPNFETQLRKRPTAVANEGTSNAFVSCSLTEDFSGNAALGYGLVANNNDTVPVDMTCTLVAGIKANGVIAPIFIPKTFTIPAGGVVEVTWDSDDNGGEDLPMTGNFSCNLPVKTEVAAVYVAVEDGSAEPPPAP